jgi:hypothetical protein
MFDASSIFYLAIFTLGTALALGLYQFVRVKQTLKKESDTEEVFKR